MHPVFSASGSWWKTTNNKSPGNLNGSPGLCYVTIFAAQRKWLCFRNVTKTLVYVFPLPLQILIRSNGRRGERVILPPRDQRGYGGNARRHQLFHGGALDGQHGLAQSAEHLIGQCQQQDSGAGDGCGRDVILRHG